MSKRAFGGIQSAPRLALPASPHRLSREERLVDNGTWTPRGVGGFLLAAAVLLAACSPGPDVSAEPTPTAVVSPPTPGEAVVLEAAECPGDAVIAQNPGHAVRSAVRLLRARTDNREALKSQYQLRIEILLKDNL